MTNDKYIIFREAYLASLQRMRYDLTKDAVKDKVNARLESIHKGDRTDLLKWNPALKEAAAAVGIKKNSDLREFVRQHYQEPTPAKNGVEENPAETIKLSDPSAETIKLPPTQEEFVYLKIPAGAWTLLSDTLLAEVQDTYYSRKLRNAIRDSLASAETLKLDHVFVFAGNDAVTAVTDRDGKEIGDQIVVIDYDQEEHCPACHEELNPDEACCPNCGLDTDADTNENAIKAYFNKLGGPLPSYKCGWCKKSFDTIDDLQDHADDGCPEYPAEEEEETNAKT